MTTSRQRSVPMRSEPYFSRSGRRRTKRLHARSRSSGAPTLYRSGHPPGPRCPALSSSASAEQKITSTRVVKHERSSHLVLQELFEGLLPHGLRRSHAVERQSAALFLRGSEVTSSRNLPRRWRFFWLVSLRNVSESKLSEPSVPFDQPFKPESATPPKFHWISEKPRRHSSSAEANNLIYSGGWLVSKRVLSSKLDRLG